MKRLHSNIHRLLCIICLSLFATAVRAQGFGVPFFKAFSTTDYHAHSRNFDVTCDSTGRVFLANFEGLLVYDGYRWSIHHTPKTTRVTAVFTAKDGCIWFAGPNFLGYCNHQDSLIYVKDENDKSVVFSEVSSICEINGKIHFDTTDGQRYCYDNKQIRPKGKTPFDGKPLEVEGDKVLDRLTVPGGNVYEATSSKGLFVHTQDGRKSYHITTDNKLPSNSINALAYDGYGTIWGATDNGIFAMKTSNCITYYNQDEGISGMVTCLYQMGKKLLIGTLQGMLILQDGVITPEPGITHGCWAMVPTPDQGGLLIATSDGVFLYRDGAISRLTEKHALSIYFEDSEHYLCGEFDGISRHGLHGGSELLQKIPNVSKFYEDKDGSLWIINLDNETYRRKPGAIPFVKAKTDQLNNLFQYRDYMGYYWRSGNNGLGLVCSEKDPLMDLYNNTLAHSSIAAMFNKDSVAWVGGTFGLLRWDFAECHKQRPILPRLLFRRFSLSGRHIFWAAATDAYNVLGTTQYSYRLHNDDEWTPWSSDQDFDFTNLSPGNYQLQVRAMDNYGQVVFSDVRVFTIDYPWYMSWYAVAFYLLVIVLLLWGIFRYRLVRLRKEQERLEAIVDERTQELRDAQTQLIRKEKEATVGKLTQGLIDRILNPMNYINNFSHLTLGLVKDLREDIEDEKENMSEDNYDDCQDVLDMMSQNVGKIEQHGLSTTRILKAMEEMLRDRSGKVERMDLAALCDADIKKLHTYFAEDIERLHIDIDWQRPAEPAWANVNADLFSKTVMSMLNNSMYYLIKKVEKSHPQDFTPLVRLSINPRPAEGQPLTIHIYDNGLGIEEGIINKIFDPFFTTKPTNDASGVGLYLSQQIIQDLGGTITVTSTKGEYTDFVITLP